MKLIKYKNKKNKKNYDKRMFKDQNDDSNVQKKNAIHMNLCSLLHPLCGCLYGVEAEDCLPHLALYLRF